MKQSGSDTPTPRDGGKENKKMAHSYGNTLDKINDQDLLKLIADGTAQGFDFHAIGAAQTWNDWYHRARIMEARHRGLLNNVPHGT